ncbi:MAG TPA: hypothetical protein VNZ05_03110, partial [Solirubrobacteraceae bacterium]|nr:hypothetical protein [Solirubrobacteraceae bacterium]
ELGYAVAYTVFRFVAEQWDEQTAIDFFVQLIGPHSLGAATMGTLNLGRDVFLQQWQTYVRRLRP